MNDKAQSSKHEGQSTPFLNLCNFPLINNVNQSKVRKTSKNKPGEPDPNLI